MNEYLVKMNGFMHRFGLHNIASGTGGTYLGVWGDFMKRHDEMKDNPYFILGFGMGLMDRIARAMYLP